MRPVPSSLLALVLLAATGVGGARAASEQASLSPAASLLAAYLAVDTSNPPGNERAGAELLARTLRGAGIEPRLLVSPGGRVSLYARLPATATAAAAREDTQGAGAIVLLHHIDTVPAGDGWRHPPHGGEIHDGELWGRGAIDTKGLGVAHLLAFLDLARAPHPRRRDVVFLAVADEEAGGGEGTEWLLAAHPELFTNVAAVLNEGGVNKAVAGRALFWGIEVDQKRPLWLEVRAAGRAGHASAANPESATHRLIAGLARLVAAPRARRVTPAAADFLRALARFDPQARGALVELRALEAAQLTQPDPAAAATPPRSFPLPGFESLLTDTVQITTLAGSARINVVAGEARAGIDVRLLPDTDERAFVAELARTLGPDLTLSVRLTSPAAPPSSAASPLYRAIAEALQAPAQSAASPGPAPVPVVPAFIPAFTDSRFFRARGIAAYGLQPFALDGLTLRTVHAPDERIPLTVLESGVETMRRVLRALALAPPPAPGSATPRP